MNNDSCMRDSILEGGNQTKSEKENVTCTECTQNQNYTLVMVEMDMGKLNTT